MTIAPMANRITVICVLETRPLKRFVIVMLACLSMQFFAVVWPQEMWFTLSQRLQQPVAFFSDIDKFSFNLAALPVLSNWLQKHEPRPQMAGSVSISTRLRLLAALP